MKQNNFKTKPYVLSNRHKSKLFPIARKSFSFSIRIASKYTIFRKSGRLPVLIFLRLFGTRIVNKITNVNYIESISNYYRLYFNLYFKPISRLEQMLGYSNRSQNYLYSVDYIKTQPGARILSNYASYFKKIFLYLKNIFQQELYVKMGNTVLKNEIASLRPAKLDFARNDGKEGLAMIHKGMLSVIQLLNQISQILQDVALMGGVTMQSTHPSPSNPAIPPFLKRGEGGLFSWQIGILTNGIPSISLSHKYSKFLNRNVLKHAGHILILKPLAVTGMDGKVFKTGSQTFAYQNAKKNHEAIVSHTVSRGDFSRPSWNEEFYFHKTKNIKQEVGEVKKIVVETKESVRETFLSHLFSKDDMDKRIKQHLDINRLSDQVYQNIERRIMIERERRGL